MTDDEWDFYLWNSKQEQQNIDKMLDDLLTEESKLHKENVKYLKSINNYGKKN